MASTFLTLPPTSTTISTANLATSAKQDLLLAELQLKADLTETQPVSAASLPLPAGAATSANQTNKTQMVQLTDGTNENDFVQLSSAVTSSNFGLVTQSVIHGLNSGGGGTYVDVKVNPSGALTTESTLSASVGTRIGTVAIDQTTPGTTNAVSVTNASLAVTGTFWQATQPVSAASLPLPSGAATEATSSALNTLTGAVTETAPATDTASSGLNGRLQRIAQRLTSLIALIPAALGAQTSANSFSVVPASDAKFSVKPSAITAEFAESLTISTVVTITAPANAVSVIIQASDSNGANVRVKQGGGTATTTSGIQFQAGRSEHFMCGTDLSVCSESGTNALSFQWFKQI